jgi:hypothetical protein
MRQGDLGVRRVRIELADRSGGLEAIFAIPNERDEAAKP